MELANLFTDLKFGKWLIFISKFTKWIMEFFEWIILSIFGRMSHLTCFKAHDSEDNVVDQDIFHTWTD